MCRQLTLLARNEYQQMVMICEHDTIHLVHRHTTLLLSRKAFYQLDGVLRSRCLATNGVRGLRFKQTEDGDVELWVDKGAFLLDPVALFALAKIIRTAADRLRTTPLSEIIGPQTDSMGRWSPSNPSLN
jgi:hypothetical protein